MHVAELFGKHANALHSITTTLSRGTSQKTGTGPWRILDFERSSLDESRPCGELEGL